MPKSAGVGQSSLMSHPGSHLKTSIDILRYCAILMVTKAVKPMNYNVYLKMFQMLKAKGMTKLEALSCLSFEGDQILDDVELKAALEDVYGGD